MKILWDVVTVCVVNVAAAAAAHFLFGGLEASALDCVNKTASFKGKESLPALDAMVKANPRCAAVYVRRGDANATGFDFRAAESDYSKAIALESLCARAFLGRARVYRDVSQFQKALADFDAAIACGANEIRFSAALDKAYLMEKLHRYPESLKQYHLLLAGSKDKQYLVHERLGSVYRELHHYHEALSELDLAVKLAPNAPQPRRERSRVYRSLRQWQKAADDLTVCIKLSAHSGRVFKMYRERSQMYERLGLHQLAAEDMKSAQNMEREQFLEYIPP